MDFGFREEEVFRQEVRQFLQEAVTPELQQDFKSLYLWSSPSPQPLSPRMREFIHKMGERGWLSLSWSKEYGGVENHAALSMVLTEELGRFRLPRPSVEATLLVGPIICRFGTEEQKKEWLPRIASGEIHFALGYTEPEAGTDLASLKMTARRQGDYYVLSGQKTFNSAVHQAEYHWVAARTDPNAATKHRGLSIFIVPLDNPGITIRPQYHLSGNRTSEVFYDEVRIPAKNRIGEENKGWDIIRGALAAERVWFFAIILLEVLFDDVVQYAKESNLIQSNAVRSKLAEIATAIHIGRLLTYNVLWMEDRKMDPEPESAMVMRYNIEVGAMFVNEAMKLLGPCAQLQEGSKYVPLNGDMEHCCRNFVIGQFGPGGDALMKGLYAMWRLRMPRLRQ